jgi:hypothetical protein
MGVARFRYVEAKRSTRHPMMMMSNNSFCMGPWPSDLRDTRRIKIVGGSRAAICAESGRRQTMLWIGGDRLVEKR